MRTAKLKKISKNFEKRFDKLRNCDILNITPQFVVKRTGGVEIKKVSKKFEIKFDKLKTCAKLNITPQFAKRTGEVDKRSRCDLESCLKIE